MGFDKPNIILLSTKTLHHLALIKKINESNKYNLIIIFVLEKIKKKNLFFKKQEKFEKKFFFNNRKYNFYNQVYYVKDVNSEKTKKIIISKKPKLGILFGTKKVDKQIIRLFKKRLLNIHRGIMENYRGLDSEFWACYYNDFNSIGTTIHIVNKYLDKGKLIFQNKLKLKKKMKAYQLRYYTTLIAIKNIIKIINMICYKKKIITNHKNQKHGKYYSSIPNRFKEIAYKKFDNYCLRLK